MKADRPSAMRTSMNPPPPMLPGRRVRHRQREAHRNRRINGVAAVFENLHAGIGGVRFPRDHHAMTRAHRLRGPYGNGGRNQQQG